MRYGVDQVSSIAKWLLWRHSKTSAVSLEEKERAQREEADVETKGGEE